MVINFRLKFVLGLICTVFAFHLQTVAAKPANKAGFVSAPVVAPRDTTVPNDIMEVITTIVNSSGTFDIDAVSDLYTPNAVVSDDEPPYSWNGPTAGVQWVNAVEKACKENRLTKLKGAIGSITVYAQSTDNVYVVVPVRYTGLLPGKRKFSVNGAFTFVLRKTNDKWLVKSQTWLQEKAITGE